MYNTIPILKKGIWIWNWETHQVNSPDQWGNVWDRGCESAFRWRSFPTSNLCCTWGTPFCMVLCGSSLCSLRCSFFFSFLCGHIRSEVWEYVSLRGWAFFATCFLLMKLRETNDGFKNLRVQGLLKARLVVSLVIKFPQNLLVFRSIRFQSMLCGHSFFLYSRSSVNVLDRF